MKELRLKIKYFNIKDTLECGQLFRYKAYENGYLVFSKEKCAYVRHSGEYTYIQSEDIDYFYNYFDFDKNYQEINEYISSQEESILKISSSLASGIRLVNQDVEEVAFSFIISQNNNIPRIKLIIEKLCKLVSNKKDFLGQMYYAFPSAKQISTLSLEELKSIGLGYRAEYIYRLAKDIVNNRINLYNLKSYSTEELRKSLISIYGIGPKVADCIILFGYKREDSFPVDTWIEKVYREDFNGQIKERQKISKYFVDRFKNYSGYVQQYLFYYKRSLENKKITKK